MPEGPGASTTSPPRTRPTDTNPSSRPTIDRHAPSTRDHVSRQDNHAPKVPRAISAPRRLTITTPDDRAEAVQFTSGVIAGWWDSGDLWAWLSLDALREQWPDAQLTWLDDETARESVFVAEVIWLGEDPVDGRDRIAVCRSLDDAVTALREDDSDRPDLVATEVTGSELGTDGARTWAVHERGTEPDDEGNLWITEEPIRAVGQVPNA